MVVLFDEKENTANLESFHKLICAIYKLLLNQISYNCFVKHQISK